MKIVYSRWTEERIEQFKDYYAREWTHNQIGAEMGITRNASIGKAHRLKLPPRDPCVTPRVKRRAGVDTGGGAVTKIKIKLQRKPVLEDKEARDLPPDQSTFAVLFLDRPTNACTWPLWNDATPFDDRMVCGAPQLVTGDVKHSWCPRHCRIGYSRPGAPRGRRKASKYGHTMSVEMVR